MHIPPRTGNDLPLAPLTSKALPHFKMRYQDGPRPASQPPIASEKVTFERKIFFLDLKENDRGRFLKITEDVGGRRDTIMLPAGAFQEFAEALSRLVEFEQKI